jgi:hypothetical protein
VVPATADRIRALIGQKVALESHFPYPVVVEAVKPLGHCWDYRCGQVWHDKKRPSSPLKKLKVC